MASVAEERVALARLRMVRVEKDLFVSDWYAEACASLEFTTEACQTLGRIGEESARERDDALAAMDEWAREIPLGEGLGEKAADVARIARRGFLLRLIDSKESTADVFERAALLAPPMLGARLQRLADEDVRHANEIRRLLVEEVHQAWATRHRRDVE